MKHGTKLAVALLIVSIDARLNKNGMCTIETEKTAYNEKGVFQLTQKYLDNLAFKAGATNGAILGNALATSMDDSFLHMEFMWVEAGEKIGENEDGSPILNKEGGDCFTVSHFRTEQFVSIELGGDATDYVTELNKEVDKDEIKEARKAMRENNSRKSAAGGMRKVAAKIDVIDEEGEGDEGEEGEGGAEMFSAPKTETKPKKK